MTDPLDRLEQAQALAAKVTAVSADLLNEFDYGDEISMEWMEDHLALVRDTTMFNFAIMALTPVLKSKGYRISRKGMTGRGFRLLLREEMGEFVISQEIAKLAHTRSNREMLIAVDTDGMSPQAIQALQHHTNVTAMIFDSGRRVLTEHAIPARMIPINPLQVGREDDAETNTDD